MTSGTKNGRPKPPEHAITVKFRAGLHQCDPLAVVWHGRYFEWLEQARTELFRSVDLAVPQLMALGVKMYVVDANCRYMTPLLYDHQLSVTAWFLAGSPLIRVAYDVHNLDTDRWAARATTVLASTDDTGKLHTTTPDGILERLPIS